MCVYVYIQFYIYDYMLLPEIQWMRGYCRGNGWNSRGEECTKAR